MNRYQLSFRDAFYFVCVMFNIFINSYTFVSLLKAPLRRVDYQTSVTEFKNLVDGFQGNMVWKEIIEGRERMSKKKYSNLGGTATCVMRGVNATQDMDFIPNNQKDDDTPRQRLYYGDSWFGFVKTAENVSASNNHCVMLIKTSHSRPPKKWLEETMIDYPGGIWITM